MAYSVSITTLERMIPELQEMVLGKPQAWLKGDRAEALAWAYKVREALYIATENPTLYPQLTEAAKIFAVEVHGNRVETRRAYNSTEFAVAAGEANNQGLDIPRKSVQTSGKQTVFTIVDSWRKGQPSNDPMHFPEAQLAEDELGYLYKWAQAWKPPLMLMVHDGAVTVGPADKHVIQYAWRPSGEVPITTPPVESPRKVRREGGEP